MGARESAPATPANDSAYGSSAYNSGGERVREEQAWIFRVLDLQNAQATLRIAKEHMERQLRLAAGLAILDVGCGTGEDTRALAARVGPAGRLVGLDVSEVTLAQARARAAGMVPPPEFAAGDVHALSYADNTFDRCRCERVLQHVADPAQALRELVRVTRPGGRIVVADSDWASVVCSDPVLQAALEHNARTTRNVRIGRELGGLFRSCGLHEISITPLLGGFTAPEFTAEVAQLMQRVIAAAVAAGTITAAAAAAWPATVQQDNQDGIAFGLFPYFVVAGTKP